MAPQINTMPPEAHQYDIKDVGNESTQEDFLGPMLYSGSLDEYKSFDVTQVIGREFPELQLSEILNDDTNLRDLAITGT